MPMYFTIYNLTTIIQRYQGSPQEKFKAEWVGVVWAEFVSTSIALVTTLKEYSYRRHGGRHTDRV